jgi:hypothetical protein
MVQTDELITLTVAATATANRVHPSSLWRWCRRGCKARNGRQIRLRHVRIAGRVYTSRQWLDEFMETLTAADIEHFSPPAAPTKPGKIRGRSERERQRDVESAERRCEALGVR